MIITRTPFRISFFGGGTDYPLWYQQHGGAVLSTTIDKYCYISLRKLPPFFEHKHRIMYSKIETVSEFSEIQHPSARACFEWSGLKMGLELHHDGDLPARSGIGSSSAFTVGLVKAIMAMKHQLICKEDLAKTAIHIEQEMIGEAVGSQDQTAVAYGGLNKILFKQDGHIDVQPMLLSQKRKQQLNGKLMMFFTGISRFSEAVAQSKIDNFAQKEKALMTMREMVDTAESILYAEDSLDGFGELMHEAWLLKRQLSNKVTNSEIDDHYEKALKAGALGGKILGAGGGGFLLFYVPEEKQMAVKEALQDLVHVPFQFEEAGSQVVLYQPNGFAEHSN